MVMLGHLNVMGNMQVLNEAYPPGSLFFTTIPENPSNYTNIHGKWILKETISRESKGKIYIYEKVAEEDMKINEE